MPQHKPAPAPPHTPLSFGDVVLTAIPKYSILNHLHFFFQELLFTVVFIHALTYQLRLTRHLVK